MTGSESIADWPRESSEAAKLVIDKHGEPDEATSAVLAGYNIIRAPGVRCRTPCSRGLARSASRHI